ncbi:hypothetical protein [Neobacillus sp. Marseille-QA0830]
MIDISFSNISVDHLGTSSGIFIGNQNSLKNFSCEAEINEAFGSLAGNENKLTHNRMILDKELGEDE